MSILAQVRSEKEKARRASIFSGDYKFIWLRLKNERFNTVTGVEVVNSIPYRDHKLNIQRFHLSVSGGAIKFEYDPSKNGLVYPLLDSEHNRAFLASHYHLDLWEILDSDISKEIAKVSKSINKEIVKEKPKEVKIEKSDPQKIEQGKSVKSGMITIAMPD